MDATFNFQFGLFEAFVQTTSTSMRRQFVTGTACIIKSGHPLLHHNVLLWFMSAPSSSCNGGGHRGESSKRRLFNVHNVFKPRHTSEFVAISTSVQQISEMQILGLSLLILPLASCFTASQLALSTGISGYVFQFDPLSLTARCFLYHHG